MTKAILGIVAAAGIAGVAQAQQAVYSWSVAYGTLTTAPTASAAGVFNVIAGANAIGEAGATHARIRATLNLQGVSMNNINTGTAGTVLGSNGQASGLFYTAFDLVAANAGNNGGGFTPGWVRNAGLRPTSNPGLLNLVNGVGAVQLAQQPGLAQPGNQNTAFVDFWEIFWSPAALFTGSASWNVAIPQAFAANGATRLITNVSADPLNEFEPGEALIPTNYSSPVSVNVVPAPGALALLGLGGLVAGRRRRA